MVIVVFVRSYSVLFIVIASIPNGSNREQRGLYEVEYYRGNSISEMEVHKIALCQEQSGSPAINDTGATEIGDRNSISEKMV